MIDAGTDKQGCLDVDYYASKAPRDQRIREEWGNGRKFFQRRYPLALSQVDRPNKPKKVVEIVRHKNESGEDWNLPVDHLRHFGKFPLGKLR
jgi:hypothetical protein